jgi:hypothetical protein
VVGAEGVPDDDVGVLQRPVGLDELGQAAGSLALVGIVTGGEVLAR